MVNLSPAGIVPIHNPIDKVQQYLFSHALPREYITTWIFAHLVGEKYISKVSIGIFFFYYEWDLAPFTEFKTHSPILFHELPLFFSYFSIGWIF